MTAISPAASRKRAQRTIPLSPCERCGKTPTQRHHEDLQKPLEVNILCIDCHVRAHQANGSRPCVAPANCQVCGEEFLPERTSRSSLCSKPECLEEMGRRGAEKRWSGRATVRQCACCGTAFAFTRPRETTCSRSCGNKLAWRRRTSLEPLGFESWGTASSPTPPSLPSSTSSEN